MRDATPIAAADPATVARFRATLERQRRRFDTPPPTGRIGVAVSGGPDSLALLLLAHAAFPGAVEAATVDHGLRPESAGEAEMVAAVCARLGVPHVVRKGAWDSITSASLQAAARAYRYRELADWCAARGLGLLATAHHADDQAETLLMRLARGSGVAGLGGIRSGRPLHASLDASVPDASAGRDPSMTPLIRPLLGFTKAELVQIVADAGLRAVDDPSNDDERFDRTRARRLLASTAWLNPARLAASASHLAEADEALAWAAARFAKTHVTAETQESGHDEWLLDPADLPDEILRRIVVGILDAIEDRFRRDRTGPTTRGPDVARLIVRLRRGDSATLGHVLARSGARWRFAPAPPRRNP